MGKVDKLYISTYNDVYGALLNKDAREYVRLYYDCDMTLAEIADVYSVTRQAVHETLAKTVKVLENFESVLGLVAIKRGLNDLVAEMRTRGEIISADKIENIIGGDIE